MNTLDSADSGIEILDEFSFNFYDASMALNFWLKRNILNSNLIPKMLKAAMNFVYLMH